MSPKYKLFLILALIVMAPAMLGCEFIKGLAFTINNIATQDGANIKPEADTYVRLAGNQSVRIMDIYDNGLGLQDSGWELRPNEWAKLVEVGEVDFGIEGGIVKAYRIRVVRDGQPYTGLISPALVDTYQLNNPPTNP